MARREAVGRRGLGVDQAVQTEPVLQRQQDARRSMSGSRMVFRPPFLKAVVSTISVIKLSPGPQPLGEFRPALFGARHEQDHFHVQERRAAERILLAAVHGSSAHR